MTVLSVNKLCREDKSQTSVEIQASIVGRFDICTNEKIRQGIILIRDLTTNDSLACRVDQFHHEFIGMSVYISTWNFIYHQNTSWIEIHLDDVYPLGSNTTQSIWQQASYANQIANDLLPTLDLTMCSILDLLACPKERLVHVAGRVVSKPVQSPEQFVIELASLRGEASTLIVFQGGALMPWYHTFEIGMCHVFLYTQTASVAIQEEPVRGALAFIPGQSRTYRMSEQQVQQLPMSALATTEERLPPATPRPVETTSMATYSGTITRVIDPAFGVYELDHRLITCLFNYTDYDLTSPYRQGMQLKISCAHMLAMDAGGSAIMKTWNAPVVERGDTKAHVILVGCLRTHVQIVRFPAHTHLQPTADVSYGRLFAECVRIRADFDTLIQRLEKYAATVNKFGQSLSKQQIRKISQCNANPSRPFGDVYGDIFHHERSCSAVKTRSSTIRFRRYPSVSDVTELLLQAHQLPSHYTGATGSSREDKRVEVFLARFDEAADGMVVMGVVDAMSDGRLYFMDDTGKVPLVLLPEEKQQFCRGDVYRLRRFRLVREDLDYQEEQGETVLLDCAYILCEMADMQRVAKVKSVKQPSIAFPADATRVAGFKRLWSDEDTESLSILQVLRIQPATVSAQPDRSFELAAHIQAIRYPVVGDDGKMDTPDEVHLILTSRTQSIQHLPQLRAGCWIGIVADGKDYTVVDHSQYLPKKIRMPTRLPPSLVVDQQHTLLTTNLTEKVLRLTPITNAAPAAPEMPPRIYQVRELLLKSAEKPQTLIGNRMFHETVNVRGVVVSKGFREHHGQATIDVCARQMFEQFGVGTGQQGRRQMFFRLRQTDGLDTVDIYMDVWKQKYPLGLLPGSLATFYNVVRRGTDHGIVGKGLACTYAEVSEVRDPRAETISTERIPRKRLADITRTFAHDPMVFKAVCAFKYISSVTFSWQCSRCGTAVARGQCYRQCRVAPRVFTAHAIATLFDGTGQARAYFDGDRLVFGLLNISDAQADTIKSAVLDHGTISYNPWDHQHVQGALTLPALCRRVTSTGQTYMLYAREMGEKPKKDQSTLQKLKIHAKSKEGRTVVVPDVPKVVAVEIERLDPADCAWDLIVQMDNLCSREQ